MRAGIGGVLLGAAAAVAKAGTPRWERDVFRWAHPVPPWVEAAVWAPMQAGNALAPVAIAPLARRFGGRRTALMALGVGWGGWWLAKAVKVRVRRGRPVAVLPPGMVRPSAASEGLGFVSGHSAVAFGWATVLAPHLDQPSESVVYGLALTVACARVMVGAHLPLDVLGGAALGLVLGNTARAVVDVTDLKHSAAVTLKDDNGA